LEHFKVEAVKKIEKWLKELIISSPPPPFTSSLFYFKVRKTVSAEVNYGIRFTSWADTEQFINQLAGAYNFIIEII